ncbi:hypothetical protein [Sphingobium amiense]|uniref:hypothetical protein n=1 Tax=Sphingobium amiense TaxID=135719 RepID=UPI000F841D1D|nr:hypothetical protein [Sphingobium amiense]
MAWFYAAEWPTFAPPLTPEIGNDHACCLHPCAPHRLHGVGQVEEDRIDGHEVSIAEAMIALSIIWCAFGRP